MLPKKTIAFLLIISLQFIALHGEAFATPKNAPPCHELSTGTDAHQHQHNRDSASTSQHQKKICPHCKYFSNSCNHNCDMSSEGVIPLYVKLPLDDAITPLFFITVNTLVTIPQQPLLKPPRYS